MGPPAMWPPTSPTPATGERVASYVAPSAAQLDEVLAAAATAFPLWRATPAAQRGAVLHTAAALVRARADQIALVLTTEQGKPLAEARAEVLATADMFGWCADEALRAYGRVVPARTADVRHLVLKEPVGARRRLRGLELPRPATPASRWRRRWPPVAAASSSRPKKRR